MKMTKDASQMVEMISLEHSQLSLQFSDTKNRDSGSVTESELNAVLGVAASLRRGTMMTWLTAVILIGLVGMSSSALADDKKADAGGGKGGGAKRTTINFEDQLVEGQTQKPELFYLLQQRNNNFKRLIKLRENFLPEMRKSSEDIGRGGGGTAKGSDE